MTGRTDPADHTPARRRLAGTMRFRVTALATVAVVVVLCGAGVALVLVHRQLLVEALDDRLDGQADVVAGLIRDRRTPSTLPALGDDDVVARIVDANGSQVAASTNWGTVDEAPMRRLSRRVERSGGTYTVVVAAPLDDVSESTSALVRSLVVAVPVVACVLAALLWWLVGRTLRPVERMRRDVADIGGSDLDRRVALPSGDDEIARLAATMNGMLDRLEDSARRQQRFVADASHELRSPLTRMRAELEVDLAHPGTADMTATHRSVLDETVTLERLVDDLLQLARSDAPAVPLRREPVDLDDVVLRQARRLRSQERVTVDASGVTSAQLVGDRDQLTRAVGNLVDNAARHAVSTVTLTLVEEDSTTVLSVADDGPGVPPDQRERIFERFARIDQARTAGDGGTGLGLAITRAIVERHGGSVTVDPTCTTGARFVVRLPLA